MKKLSKETKHILLYFLTWRVALFLVAFLAVLVISKFGGRFPYADKVLEITKLPSWIWSFGNFDGVHYLRIAQNGYTADYSQAFFPLFPLLIKFLANIFPKNSSLDIRLFVDPAYFWSGIILANAFFLAALFAFYKLLRIDYSKKLALSSMVLLLVFPTSFYFGSIYTESLFLLLACSALYFLRKRRYLLSGVLISLASATRIFGILLILVYLIEVAKNIKNLKVWAGLLIAPLGLLFYMYYLNLNFGDPFYFLTSQPAFGAQRTVRQIILLPQVIFRYLKIFLTVPITSLPFFNAFLEFMFTLAPIAVLIWAFKRIRFSYWLFSLLVLLLPTLTGTLSSMPRYVLMNFLLFPFAIEKLKKYHKWLIVSFVFLAIILVSLFTRGYWIA